MVGSSGVLDRAALERLVEAGVVTHSQASALGRAQGLAVAEAGDAPGGGTAPGLPRVSLDARPLGLFLAVFGLVALVWSAATLFGDLFGVRQTIPGAGLLDAVRAVACLLLVVGGRRLWRGLLSGKPVVLIGLVLFGLSTLLLALRQLAHPVTILLVLAWTVLYYLAAASRVRSAPPPESL
jgi:hypothetical protein